MKYSSSVLLLICAAEHYIMYTGRLHTKLLVDLRGGENECSSNSQQSGNQASPTQKRILWASCNNNAKSKREVPKEGKEGKGRNAMRHTNKALKFLLCMIDGNCVFFGGLHRALYQQELANK